MASGMGCSGKPVTVAFSEDTEIGALFTAEDGGGVSMLVTQPGALPLRMVMSRTVAERWVDALADCLPAWREASGGEGVDGRGG